MLLAGALLLSGCVARPSGSPGAGESPSTPSGTVPSGAVPSGAVPPRTPSGSAPTTSAPSRRALSGTVSRSLQVGGATRSYLLHLPATLPAQRSLVVVLHGGFGSARQAEAAYGWDELADREGVLVAYPQGDGAAWNAGDCCGAPARKRTDDVAFIEAMVADVRARYGVTRARTFVTGMSNGALMAYRLACDTNLFASVAAVAGTIVTGCQHPAPISVLHIHGLDDDRVRFDGGRGSGPAGVDGMPIPDVIALWRKADDCSDAVVVERPPLTSSRSSCPDGHVVELITIAGAGHQWPGAATRREGADPPSTALDATRTSWEFFDRRTPSARPTR